MAFEALCCLRRTIHRLQKSSRISLESPRILTSEQTGVESTLKLVRFLQDFKDGIGSKKMGDLEGEIREAARELEDVVDSHVSDLILGSENRVLLLDLQGVRHDFDEFIEKMKKIERVYNPWFYEEQELDHIFGSTSDGHVITRARFVSWFADKAASVFMGVKEEYIQDLQNYQLWPEDDDGKEYALLLSDFNENEEDDEKDNDFHVRVKDGLTRWWMDRVCSISAMDEECIQEIEQPLAEVDEVGVNMVGLADLFCKIRNEFLQGLYPYSYAVITGMAGIGKTALAKSKFKDPLIISKFQHCVFVRVGQKYQEEQVIQAIAAQLNAEMLLIKDGDQEDVFEFVYKTLQNGKYLIVLDDVWDKDLFLDFIDRLPYNEGSWVLLTTRIDDLYEYGFTTFQVPFLSLDESWDLLRRNIFGEDQLCPPQLVKAGMKIAENCEGLPLLILTVARLLFEADNMSPEYWNNVAANKTNSIFVAGYELMLDVARPSYNHLPHHLKTCFLYMGAFPQNATVRISKLINLWSAEGFLDLPYTELQLQVGKYFDKLVSENNVALECERGNYGSDLRACSLHSVFWYLCKLVGWDEEFLHVLNVWCEFPTEVVKLVQLRYLALTCNGSLHPSIARLWNLQCLIVNQHQRMINTSVSHYVPVEIWELQELEYLQIMGRNLPEPPHGVVLRNLVTLLDVGAHSCNERVLSSIPNLFKLRVQIESMPGAAQLLQGCMFFDDITHLKELRSLHCVVMNPTLLVAPSLSSFAFVKKLTLSGLGHAWKEMSKLAMSPHLKVLRIKNYAFRGELWEVYQRGFLSLWELSIEDSDLVKWSGKQTFRYLSFLAIKNCYKLQHFPDMPQVYEMRVVDCHPLAKTYGCHQLQVLRRIIVYGVLTHPKITMYTVDIPALGARS